MISLSSFTEYLQASELTYVLLLTGHLTFLLAEGSEQVGDPGMNSTGKIFFFFFFNMNRTLYIGPSGIKEKL